MENLILLIIAEWLILLYSFYFSGYDIMSPSCVLCIMFLLSTIFALFNIDNWSMSFSLNTALVIITGILSFSIAEIVFRYVFCEQLKSRHVNYKQCSNELVLVSNWILKGIIIFEGIAIYAYFHDIMGIVGGNTTDISSYFHAYRVMTISNLENGEGAIVNEYINVVLRFVSGFGYLFAFLFMKNIVDQKLTMVLKIQYTTIIVLSILPSMMGAGRTGILKMGSALLIFYYICWHMKYGWNKNLSWKYIRMGLIIFFVSAPSFYYSLEMLGRETGLSLLDYISDYVGSSIFLLNDYLQNPTVCDSWGEEALFSVKKILSSLGLAETSTKYNLEFRRIGMLYSNVYTFFRRPIHDFGYFGMYVFVSLISTLFSWIYYKKIKYQELRKNYKWIIAYGYLYYWLVCSSIVQYSGNMISFGAFVQIGIAVLGYKVFVKYERVDNENGKEKFI